ncbi:MAG: formate/nitrite transporter family protein [Acetatifactor sp.]|nr:formate/nitrite transporter family protein [Acetatifactor sp.]
MFLSPKEAVEAYRAATIAKSKTPTAIFFGKSILAGMMIGMGAAAGNVAAHDVANVGMSRVAAAVVFPVGLMMVIFMGAELFTGDCLMAMGLPEKDISLGQFIKALILVYLGNLVGGVALTALVATSGQLDYSAGKLGAYTIKVALGKAMISPEKALASGILCNILVSAAVLMAMCAKDAAGKLLVSFFVIMLFVTSGYEHCVANMYYITAGLFAKTNPAYTAAAKEVYGIGADQLASLNIVNMAVKNLLPVTIGNIIGGSLCVALPMYYLNHNKK